MGTIGRNALFYIIFLSASFIFFPNALGDLTCNIQASCPASDTVPFKISSATNGHAALPSETNAPYNTFQVCCTGVPGLSASCGTPRSVILLKLSAATNAHVQKNTFSGYSQTACLAAPVPSNIVCSYSTNCANLGSGYTCLASISADTNAHIGNCAAYSTKLCCSTAAEFDFTISTVDAITATVGEATELRVQITNVGSTSDQYTVTFTSNLPNTVDISNPTITTETVPSNGNTFASTLLRPLIDGDNIISVTVASTADSSMSEVVTIPMRSAKFSLPEFGLFGLIQIIILASIVFFVYQKRI